MENQEKHIPAGYREDARGALIPEASIKPIDKERDELVQAIVRKAENVHEILKGFKNEAFGDIAAFVELSAEQYGAKTGGKKGNVTLYSFDGQYKVQRAVSETLQFDERIQGAKSLIEECLQDWTAGSRDELKTIIDRAFDVDKEGNLNTNKILALRRVDIKDDRWRRAMDAISDSVQVIGSKSYIRVYKRIGNTDKYAPISLDLASI
jgi:putative sulfate transport protein cysZ